ncbi:MAG: patatin family protein [Bacilli bacterium]|nr:patatin family protein [Bacilli bacterium]
MKVGLVLEGGALRGIYTAGVLDVLLKNNVKVDKIIGVSAGALFGVNYKSNQPGRALRYNKKYCNNKNYMSFYSFFTTGNIVNREFCFDKLVNELDPFDYETYSNNNIDFYATVTNLETGKAEYHLIKDIRNEKDSEYLRASGSMPFVSRIVEVDGKKYLDGAIADSIPVDKMLTMSVDKIIVVPTRPIDFRRRKKTAIFNKLKYKKYPKFVDKLSNRYKMYNKEVERIIDLENQGKVFVIRPSRFVNIKRLEKNPEIIQEMYDLGVSDTKSKLKELKKYLES